MSRFGRAYQVSPPTGVCAHTGEPFAPGATCVATHCEHEADDGFDRRDFSLEAWEAGARPERLFSFWKTIAAAPGEKRGFLVDEEVLVDLFMRLEGESQPQRVAFRFVLALILMRKRVLRFVGRRPARGDPEGGESAPAEGPPAERWLLRRRGSTPDEPPLELTNPRMSDGDVRELAAQLGEILQSEF